MLHSHSASTNRRSGWTPPIWAGCDISALGRLIARHRYAVDRTRGSVIASAAASAVFQTILGAAQRTFYGDRAARTPIVHAPVFVLGHWRSGTTLLHELLACDSRHAAPTTYDCFNPHHFLLTRSWLPRALDWILPRQRLVDSMAAGWDRPQEDEFALCLLGQPSPYDRIAFPNETGSGDRTLDFPELCPRTRRRWEQSFTSYLRKLTLANDGKRLILKSPTHTFRIPTLLKLFPEARFVHIVRDPYAVYASTLNLWRVLYAANALQQVTWSGLSERILTTFEHMHASFEDGRRLIPAGRLHQMRFEDLIADPNGQLRTMYAALDLGDFETQHSRLEMYWNEQKRFESDRYLLTTDERTVITERWGPIIQQYGYPVRTD